MRVITYIDMWIEFMAASCTPRLTCLIMIAQSIFPAHIIVTQHNSSEAGVAAAVEIRSLAGMMNILLVAVFDPFDSLYAACKHVIY